MILDKIIIELDFSDFIPIIIIIIYSRIRIKGDIIFYLEVIFKRLRDLIGLKKIEEDIR
jgi:hypothetical protein